MKTLALKLTGIAIAAGAITIGSASLAHAEERVIVNVPFAFIVGDRQLPAGKYIVKDVSEGPDVLAIQSTDGRKVVCAMTIPASVKDSATQPELIFEKFSSHYFLSRILPEDGGEREIILSPALMEREIVRTRDGAGN